MKAIFEISVGGVDVSENFNQILDRLHVEGRSGAAADSADIVLADPYGEILMPSKGDEIAISLGWDTTGIANVFTGTPASFSTVASRKACADVSG